MAVVVRQIAAGRMVDLRDGDDRTRAFHGLNRKIDSLNCDHG